MASTPLLCNECQKPCQLHCESETCGWIECTNTKCRVQRYDLDRGLMMVREAGLSMVTGWGEE